MLEATETFTILEADIVKYANVQKKLSLNLKEEKEDFEKLLKGKERVIEYVEKGFQEPEIILNSF